MLACGGSTSAGLSRGPPPTSPELPSPGGGGPQGGCALARITGPLVDYLVTLDDLEERTGLDFFPMLQDNIENLIEQALEQDVWGAE